MGQAHSSAQAYVSELMRISGQRTLNKSVELDSHKELDAIKRIEVSKQIEDHNIHESNMFYLKSYIGKFYPDILNKMKIEIL